MTGHSCEEQRRYDARCLPPLHDKLSILVLLSSGQQIEAPPSSILVDSCLSGRNDLDQRNPPLLPGLFRRRGPCPGRLGMALASEIIQEGAADYFGGEGHAPVASAPLVPHN